MEIDDMVTVAQIGQVFVKATQFLHPDEVEIVKSGIRYDRDFALTEDNDTFVSSKNHGGFFPLKFLFDADSDKLRLEFADGRSVEGPAEGSGLMSKINHAGLRDISVAVVEGPWTEALSAFAGRRIRLVRCVSTGAAIDVLPITLVSTGSLRRLEREVGAAVDPARFRAGFVLDNAIEHEEDGWDGRLIRIGAATLKVRSPVPRCAITGFNPVQGVRDQDVMNGLIRYRDKAALPDGMLPGYATPGFATFAEVIEPGIVRVGDPVELLQ
jgi:uncharacterized protein YcbX